MMIDPIRYITNIIPTGGRCVFMPNGGNLEDALIGWATVRRFEKAGLKWTLFRGEGKSITANDVLVYGGGGSLVPHYTGGVSCIESLLKFGCPVVVLPQSCSGHKKFWSRVEGLTVFCRDFNSLAYMQQFHGIKALPAHDMAIDLDLTEDPLATSIAIRRATIESGELRILLAYRRDGESVVPPPSGSIDLSALIHPQMTSIASLAGNASAFLAALAFYSHVRTDRLHVAIGAALLGIPTILRDNSYGKNRSVYEASLRSRLPIIEFETVPHAEYP